MSIIILQGDNEKLLGIRYEIDSSKAPVGTGGMGQVFRGVRIDEATGVRRDAAIKFLFDDLPQNAVERARREAEVKILSENLVEMFGFIEIETQDSSGKTHKRYHVASEFLDGVMLHDLLKGKITDSTGKEMDFARELYRQYQDDRLRFAIFITRKILSGVMALHDAGYIHRDIDPSNIMITSDGKVKLIDYGICKKIHNLDDNDRHFTSAGQFMGKAAYASPELVTGDLAHQNESTDLYAIGIMLFELVTGSLPFEGPSHEVLNKQMKEELPLKKIDDKYLRGVLKKATAKKQENRYTSAAEFRVALDQLSRHSVADGDNGQPPVTGQDNKKRNIPIKILIGSLSALFIAGVVLMIIFLSPFSEKNEEKVQDDSAALVEARKAALKDEIIDDTSTVNPVDSITGLKIPTAGSLIAEANLLLQKHETVTEGVTMLQKVIDKNYKSSAMACVLLANLNSRSKVLDEAILQATDSIITPDYVKSHTLNQKALILNPVCYQAMYELALDYLAGDARGVVERDLLKASELLTEAKKYATAASDTRYIELIEAPLQLLESEGIKVNR